LDERLFGFRRNRGHCELSFSGLPNARQPMSTAASASSRRAIARSDSGSCSLSAPDPLENRGESLRRVADDVGDLQNLLRASHQHTSLAADVSLATATTY